jgi:hypothetical protein
MSVVTIQVKGTPYCIPTEVWEVALVTFDQQYPRWEGTVPSLARAIARDLMPARREDLFSEERLTRCLLSVKGRAGAKKRARLSSRVQLNLFRENDDE